MKATVEITVVATIDDPFQVLEEARNSVRVNKPEEEWDTYYPGSPSEALQLLIREGIGRRLLACEGVSLHEIGHRVSSLDL